jgi:hypothetical protein
MDHATRPFMILNNKVPRGEMPHGTLATIRNRHERTGFTRFTRDSPSEVGPLGRHVRSSPQQQTSSNRRGMSRLCRIQTLLSLGD